jgi:hypothetical protein
MLKLKTEILLLNNTNPKMQNQTILSKLIKNMRLYLLLINDNHPNYPISTIRIASGALSARKFYFSH